MAKVARPMMSRVVTRVFLRPRRSPKWPKSTAPKGRKTKATPKVATAAHVAADEPREGKKSGPKTRAAAVPEMRKS